MQDHEERRKLWKFNLSPGNWIAIFVFVFGLSSGIVGGAVSYARATDKIDDNTKKIEKVEEGLTKQIKETKEELSKEIKESESRTRSDIRELRQIMLNNK